MGGLPAKAGALLDTRGHVLDSSKIETVVPTPLRLEGAADRLYYVFHMAKPGDPLFIALNLQAEQTGLVDGRIGVDDGREVAFKQLVYP